MSSGRGVTYGATDTVRTLPHVRSRGVTLWMEPWASQHVCSEGNPPLALFMTVACTKRRGQRPETLISVTRRAFPVTLTGDLVIAAGDPVFPGPESVTMNSA